MRINKKNIYWLLGGIAALYVLFVIKKAYVDKGYPSQEVEKEIMLGHYVIMKGLENTKTNRDKYRSMTLPELYTALGINSSDEPPQ
jgi:hypothetical protein